MQVGVVLRVIVVFPEADPRSLRLIVPGSYQWPTTLINHVGRVSLRVTVGIEPPANEAKLVVRPARMHLIHPQREAVALPVKVLALDRGGE